MSTHTNYTQTAASGVFSGDWWYPRTDHHMQLTHPFRSRKHADKMDKPVVDCSSPYNFISRQENAERWGYSMGFWQMNSIAHFTAIPEQIPYSFTYSSADCITTWMIFVNVFFQNLVICRIQLGNVYPQNPRTMWAHRVVWLSMTARLNVCSLIGLCGYFYGYEFLYTYVPYFRIRDPSPEGWKRCWEEGQSTFLARAGASFSALIAHGLWSRSFKRSPFWLTMVWFHSWCYEWCRPCFSGNHIFYQGRSNYIGHIHGKYGSLVPDPERRMDPDTGRPQHAANYKYQRFSHSQFQDDAWANLNNDYMPTVRVGSPYPNVHFNWQKSARGREGENHIYRTHNAVWDMPQVLTPRMMSGVMDKTN